MKLGRNLRDPPQNNTLGALFIIMNWREKFYRTAIIPYIYTLVWYKKAG